ncbi:MAG: hypothetical protein ACKO3D_01250 [Actinomycetota bacterium]
MSLPVFLPVARFTCPFLLTNLISVLSEMIPKEIMKRGGILSRLAQFKEESPYKPDTFNSLHFERDFVLLPTELPTRLP